MSDGPATPFVTRRRVEFADTDAGGLVHFSRFFVFMETAEHELLRSLGSEVHYDTEAGQIGWPRVEATCRYLRPVRFTDELTIEVRVERIGERSVTYGFRLVRADELVAQGRLTSVCCELLPGERPRSMPVPDEIAAALRQYEA